MPWIPPSGEPNEELGKLYRTRAGYMFGALVLSLLVLGVSLYDTYTNAHILAVDDLCALTTNNINLPLEFALASTISLASQGVTSWQLNNGPTKGHFEDLVPVMQALLTQHSRFGAESVQYGSPHGAMIMLRKIADDPTLPNPGGYYIFNKPNGSSCALCREYGAGATIPSGWYTSGSGSACNLNTYLNTTEFGGDSQKLCNYEPAQTEWYRGGRDQTEAWKYGEMWLPVSSSYTILSNVSGMSSAVAAINGTGKYGVWAADFKLGALTTGLQAALPAYDIPRNYATHTRARTHTHCCMCAHQHR